MVNATLKSIFLLFTSFFFVFVSLTTHAQDNFDEFIEAGSADASAIYEAYGTPLFSGLNWAFSRGWYNTAKPHKPLGFDFSLNVSIAFVPSKDEFYNIGDVQSQWNTNAINDGRDVSTATRFSNVTGGQTQFPTLVGPNSPAPEIEIWNPEREEFQTIVGPTGFDYANDIIPAAVPVALPQFGIGLIKNTDLKFRFLPTVGSDDVKLNMFGIGLMHDIKQWIPGNSVIPIEISALVAYSNTSLEVRNIDDEDPDPGDDALFDQTSWTYQLLVSRSLFNVLTVYGGFGYSNSRNDIQVLGEYNVIATGEQPISDPIDIETTDSGFNASLGLRLKLAILTLHADYSIQEYQTVNAGLGISVR